MVRTTDLREKEVINIRDGARLGMISDIDVNLDKGIIESITLPGPGKIFGLFGKDNDIVIKWKDINKIGMDVILVDLDLKWDESDKNRENTY